MADNLTLADESQSDTDESLEYSDTEFPPPPINIAHTEIMDLEQILQTHADFNRRPLINLFVNDIQTTFLCDSGACRSVLNSSAGLLPMSDDAMAIKTASGVSEIKMLTTPIVLYDPETTLQTSMQFIVHDSCPCNLLGRDGMTALQIDLVSSPEGMLPYRRSATGGPGVLVMDADSVLSNHYYSLDLDQSSSTRHTPGELVKTLDQYFAREGRRIYQAPSNLHVTMCYLFHDNVGNFTYEDDIFHSLTTQQSVTLLHLYWSTFYDVAFATVKLTAVQDRFFRRHNPPHIAMVRPPRCDWGDVGELVQRVVMLGNFTPHATLVEVQQDLKLHFERIPLTGWSKPPATVGKHIEK